nr:MFS transporter [Candidatus Sigynarchaeota archaeon]
MSREGKSIFSASILLFIISVAVVYSIQNLISPGLLTMSNYFGFSGDKTQMGTLTFSFTLTSGVSIIIFGYLADKIKRVRMLVLGATIVAVSAMLTILVIPNLEGFNFFFTLQMIFGIGAGAIIPTTFSLIGDIVTESERARGYSFFSVATLIGTAVGVVSGSILIEIDWRLSYVAIGIAGAAVTAFLFFLKEPNRVGKDYLLTAGENVVEYTYRIKISDLKQIFKKKTNIWLIVNFVDTIPTGIILFLLFAYLKEIHNVQESHAILFLAFVLVSTLVGTAIFGYVGDNLFKKGNKRARVLLALMANVAPIPFVFLALNVPFWIPDGAPVEAILTNPGAILMIVLMSTGLFINGATNGCWYATVVDINLPEHRGTTLATANFFDIIGRAIGPLIGAVLADTLGMMVGINFSIISWVLIPLFWIGVLKNVIPDMEATKKMFDARLAELVKRS